MSAPFNRRQLLLLAVVVALAVFALDCSIELGVAAAVPYASVVWLAYLSGVRRGIWVAAVICTLLTFLGLLVSPLGGEIWKGLANRGLALTAIWGTAVPCLRVLGLMEELRLRAESAEAAVAEIARRRENDVRKTRAMVSIVEDLKHERQRLREEMANSERLADIVNSAEDAIIGLSREGIVSSWNKGATKLYGYTEKEMIGQPISRLAPTDGQSEADRLEEMRCCEARESFETVRVGKDGTPRHVSLTVSPVLDSEGCFVGTSTIGRDISVRKRLERELQEANRNLEQRVQQRTAQLKYSNRCLKESNIELQQFAYVASHDLQTPLRAIAGFARFLESDYGEQLDDTAKDYIERIVRGTKRMQRLINDLLEFSRVQSRATPFKAVPLNRAFDDAREMLAESIADEQAEVVRDDLPEVRGDNGQIVQLLQNLIGNGIKYHSDRPAHVAVKAERNGAGWRIAVHDNGIGIAPEHQKQIFGIFNRLHTAASYPGTGIGLAICRRIVQRHGGRIWVESKEGEGSTFFFTLPDESADTRSRLEL